MNVSEYAQLQLLSGTTITEFELAEIFLLDPVNYSNMEDFSKDISFHQVIDEEYKLPDDGTFTFKDKIWNYDKDILKTTPQQWAKMHELLSANHGSIDPSLLSIYVRPQGEVFDINKLDEITKLIWDMPAEIFIALNNFFFANAQKCMKYMGIHYLNQLRNLKLKKYQKQIGFGWLTLGFLYLKGLPRMILLNLKSFLK